MKLILKLVAGMLIGMLLGLYGPLALTEGLVTFKSIFGQFISFMIPLIILFYIMSGIASLGNDSGRMLGWTVVLAYGSTILAGTLAFLVASNVLPSLLDAGVHNAQKPAELAPYFVLEVKPMFDVMTALVLAFVFGIGIAMTKADRLREFADQGRDVVELMLAKVLIPLLPAYIGCVFAEMAADGTVFSTLETFGKVLVLAISMHIVWLSGLFIVTGLANGKHPLKLIKAMLPAYFTAVGTMSSAATIPVTLKSARNMGVSEPVVDFVIPLCATIHLSGSTITLTTCATAVMLMTAGLADPTWAVMFPFIMMLGVIMVAAPGAPGGAVMSALGVLSTMLHFPEASLALMIALYLAQDSFGTACNVTGDGVIALWMDRIMGKPKNGADKLSAATE